MHIIDRAAFYHLGVKRRAGFIDRFVSAVISEVRKCLKKPFSAADFIGPLQETFERRQHEYARYKGYFLRTTDRPRVRCIGNSAKSS